MPSSIAIEQISKHFALGKTGRVQALHPFSLEIEEGEIFGLLGPDGAGKTTLFRILTTLMLPDSGTAIVGGYDILKDMKKIRASVGYMPGRFSLYQDLSVEENLQFFATLFNTTLEAHYDFIKDIYTHIEPFKKRKAGNLSGGMKQKLALCCALIHKPRILFLDEPTTGVDPVSRKEFWDMLKRLKAGGMTILASTPYMDEAELCDRIGLIQSGRFIGCNTPEQLRAEFTAPLRAVRATEMSRLLRDLRDYRYCRSCYAFGEFHHISLEPGFSDEDLTGYLQRLHFSRLEIHPLAPTIEDCFMALMQKGGEHAQ